MWHQANYISVVYLGDMLAGIIICVLVLAGLAFGVPWLMGGRETVDEVDGDPSERFSDSVRVLHRDVIDYQEAADAAPISTPLMRKAERGEVKLLARQAARRRRRAILGLTFLLLTTTGVALFDLVPLWTIAIPAGLIVMYLVFARINSALMYRALDQRVKKADEGYDEEETSAISLAQPEESVEISVDLAAPKDEGMLWDPIPVTTPNYVSKPLVPRSVRTIDLSAPVADGSPLIPTADRPDDDEQIAPIESESDESVKFRPRVVGE